MKKIIISIVTILLVFCFPAQCDTQEYDFSDLTIEELSTLIDKAQAQLRFMQVKAAGLPDAEYMAMLSNLPAVVTEARCMIQSEEYKSVYPDYLQAIIVNNSEDDIQDVVVAFAAWDENGLPVKIRGQYDFGNVDYIKEVSFSEVNAVPGATFGDNKGYKLSASCNIATVRAIVVSYTGLNYKTWKNPYYESFAAKYRGRKLADVIG